MFAAALFLVAALAVAQDADKQKMIEIEKAFAAHPNAGPEAMATAKQYLYEGTLIQLTGQGQVGTLPKSRIVELNTTPNPSDPDVKSAMSVSGFHIEIYGETALVAYKVTNSDTGHKDAALNTTDHYGCLDTFVKRGGQWSLVANACSPSEPLPRAEWNAAKKAMAEMPKDVKDSYH
jgi:hypothetical protein